MTFRVGQKVVCVDAAGEAALELGSVYTISEILPPTFCRWRGLKRYTIGLWFAELPVDDEYGYAPERFRPVVERKTDISFAHEILRKASKPARGPAVTSPHGATP
jgi:hypothetical protein